MTAAITVNDEPHTSGTAATWEEGENIVEITCTGDDMETQVYTVTVTKETPAPDPDPDPDPDSNP